MKMIFKIAKTEIRQLFYSPIAWFLLIVFMVQCGFIYTEVLDGFARRQELGGSAMTSMKTLTSWIFSVRDGIYASVLKNLFLYIPLLTMGLISREMSSGTIKLLYSSPVTVTQIVMGKYVAMLIYSLCLSSCIALSMVIACFNIQAPDIPLMLSGLLGIYLLLCTYAAIGLFMSSLTTYQILAGVGTFIMIGVLTYIGNVWQRYDFIRDLTYFLSLTGRTENLLSGLISSRDVIYFLVIIYIFLAFTILRMRGGRETRTLAKSAGMYSAVLVSALVIGYITSRPGTVAYFDVTAIKSQSLAPKVKQIVGELGDDPLEVTAYSNLLGSYYEIGLPENRNRYIEFWNKYLRYKPDISFRYVNYYDSAYDTDPMTRMIPAPGTPVLTLKQQAEVRAKSYDYSLADYKSPEEMQKIIDLRPELTRFVMQLRYKGRSTFLRVFNDFTAMPEEPEVAAAFKRLQDAKFPKIVFITGNLERSLYKTGSREYGNLANNKTFRYSFVNQGFDMDTVCLDKTDIPGDADLLVLADPLRQLSPGAAARITSYIARGGNMLVAGEPGRQSIVNPLLSTLGVQLMSGSIAEPDPSKSPDRVIAQIAPDAAMFSKDVEAKIRSKAGVMTLGVTGLLFTADSGFSVKTLLTNNPELSFLKKDGLVADTGFVSFDEAAGDQRRIFPLAVALTRKVNGKEQHIVVTGDADFLSNDLSTYYLPQAVNFTFNTGMFSWLCNGTYPIDASRPESRDRRLNISSDHVKQLRIAMVWAMPGVLMAFASILLLRRRRK